jgi:hypothetical protein
MYGNLCKMLYSIGNLQLANGNLLNSANYLIIILKNISTHDFLVSESVPDVLGPATNSN